MEEAAEMAAGELTAERARAVFLQYAEEALAEVASGSDRAVAATLFLAAETWNATVLEDFEGSNLLSRAVDRWIRTAGKAHRRELRRVRDELVERKRRLFPEIRWMFRGVRLERLDDGARFVRIEAVERGPS